MPMSMPMPMPMPMPGANARQQRSSFPPQHISCECLRAGLTSSTNNNKILSYYSNFLSISKRFVVFLSLFPAGVVHFASAPFLAVQFSCFRLPSAHTHSLSLSLSLTNKEKSIPFGLVPLFRFQLFDFNVKSQTQPQPQPQSQPQPQPQSVIQMKSHSQFAVLPSLTMSILTTSVGQFLMLTSEWPLHTSSMSLLSTVLYDSSHRPSTNPFSL